MPEPKRPLKVFLCHASTDKPKVRELYRYLKRRGINPWFDEEHLVGGQDWQVEIPKALATSDAIIICLTKNSVDKEGYIQKEIKFALDKALEMPEGRIFLIPVKFEECEVPFTLSRYQWVDLTVESGYAKMMKALKFRASHLERSTIEVSKKDVEEENLAREKAEKESAEKSRLEAEELARQKSAKEKAEHEVIERAERERKEKELREKQVREAREKAKRVTEKKEEKPATIKPKAGSQTVYWFGGFIVLVLGIMFLSSLNNSPSTSEPTPENTQTQAIATLAQITVEPSATTTPRPATTPTNTITSTPLPTEITDAKGATMRLIPAGEFTMGSTTGNSDEQPVHHVYLDAFYMDAYEVTNSLYKACVDAGGCLPPQRIDSYSLYGGYYYGTSKYNDYPVILVDWERANTYCKWRDANLPTEAQWEKAARGTDSSIYPWGENISGSNANFNGYKGDTAKVGSYESGKSTYNIYDLAGNVSEWTADWYSETYYQNSPFENPLGADLGTFRVLRGGSYTGNADALLAFNRSKLDPKGAGWDIGFRCARNIITVETSTSLPTPSPSQITPTPIALTSGPTVNPVTAILSANPRQGKYPLTVNFSANLKMSDGTLVCSNNSDCTYYWSVRKSTTTILDYTNRSISYQFPWVGTYYMTVTVCYKGMCDSDTASIIIDG